MKVLRFVPAVVIFTFLFSCQSKFRTVYPAFETAPVNSTDDAADDIAIFIHPNDINKNAIIGTDKQRGLVVYDTKGSILHDYEFGRINNVDIRSNVPWNEGKITIVGGSNRTDNSLVFYQLNEETLELHSLLKAPVTSGVNEVYGFCLYKPKDHRDFENLEGPGLFAFVVGKDGVVEQWALSPTPAGILKAKLVRSFDVGSQCEGLVADDTRGHLYVGEEEVGIWKYSAQPNGGETRFKVQLIAENSHLKADIEGLTIYNLNENDGFLLASSQGNNSYAVFDRNDDNTFLGSFKIKSSDTVDGTSDTDGIDVTPLPFSPEYPSGVFIAQDGKNKGATQNFKVVDWRKIELVISNK